MHETQAKLLIEELTKLRKACEGINEEMRKLNAPLFAKNNVLSSQDLDSLAGLPPGFSTSHTPVKVERVGFRNQEPATSVRSMQAAIAQALDNVNGRGFSSGAYEAELWRHMRNLTGNQEMSKVLMESLILTYTGNQVHDHWENQAGTEISQS